MATSKPVFIFFFFSSLSSIIGVVGAVVREIEKRE